MSGALEAAGVGADVYRASMAFVAGAVHIVTTDGRAGRAGFTASAVCSVTDAPPTLLVCMNRGASSHAILSKNGSLCVNTLGAGHEALASAFGGRVPASERFALAQWRTGSAQQPVLVGALVAFECRITQRLTVGSHDVVICEVVAIAPAREADALLYADRRYHTLPAASPVAPLQQVRIRSRRETPVPGISTARGRVALSAV